MRFVVSQAGTGARIEVEGQEGSLLTEGKVYVDHAAVKEPEFIVSLEGEAKLETHSSGHVNIYAEDEGSVEVEPVPEAIAVAEE